MKSLFRSQFLQCASSLLGAILFHAFLFLGAFIDNDKNPVPKLLQIPVRVSISSNALHKNTTKAAKVPALQTVQTLPATASVPNKTDPALAFSPANTVAASENSLHETPLKNSAIPTSTNSVNPIKIPKRFLGFALFPRKYMATFQIEANHPALVSFQPLGEKLNHLDSVLESKLKDALANGEWTLDFKDQSRMTSTIVFQE